MNDKPLISILMNCYNGSRYLIESIESALNQTYQNWELIFWDNCSTDNSYEVFCQYNDTRLRYFKSDVHTGLGMARYQALEKAKGEFIAFLDCDDVWLNSKLEKQIKKFDDKDVGIVISNTLFFTDSGKNKPSFIKKYPDEGFIFGQLLKHYYISLQTVVIKKSIINQLDHSFDPSFDHISDLDLILRVSKVSKLAIVKEVLAKWRIHLRSESWQKPEKFISEKKIFVNKLINKYPEVNDKYEKEFQYFIRSIDLRESIALIIKGEKKEARSILSKKLFTDLTMTCLYFISFFIFSKFILLKIMQLRRLNPD